MPVTLKCLSSNQPGWSFKLWILEHSIKDIRHNSYTLLWSTVKVLYLTHLLTGFALLVSWKCLFVAIMQEILFVYFEKNHCVVNSLLIFTLYALQHTIEWKCFENGGSVSWSKPQDVYINHSNYSNHFRRAKHVQYTQTDTIRQKNTITLCKDYYLAWGHKFCYKKALLVSRDYMQLCFFGPQSATTY